jgi:competence protein ComEC
VAGAALLLLFIIGLAWISRRYVGWLALLLFWLMGAGFYQIALEPPLPSGHLKNLPTGTFLNLIGTIDRLPLFQPDGLSLELSVTSWLSPAGWRPTTGRLRLRAPLLPATPGIGDQLVMRVKLSPPTNIKNPGTFDRQRFLAMKEIFTLATLPDPQHLVRLATPGQLPWPTRGVEKLRARYQQFLNQQPQPYRALFKSLLIGEEGEITAEVRRWFSRTGTSHIYSVGGMHMSMVAGVVFGMVFLLLRCSTWLLLRVNAVKLATLAAIGPVWYYGLIAGSTPPAQRSALMIMVFLVLVLIDRHRDLYNALTLTALVILIISPLMFFSLSFQLSFLCVLGMMYLLPRWLAPLKTWLSKDQAPIAWSRRGLLWGTEALAATGAATLATLPLVAASFNLIPTYSVLVNLVVIPLFGTVTLSLGLGALLVWPFSPGLAEFLLTLARYPMALGFKAIAWGADWPGGALTIPTPTPLQIAAYYLVLICLFPPRRHRWTRAGALLGALFLTGSVIYSGLAVKTSSHLEVTALDTSDEQAALVTFPGGTRMVISAGAPVWGDWVGNTSRSLLSYLHYRQIRKVDYLVALSLTRQNAASLLAVAQNFNLGQFWYEGGRAPFQAFWELKNMLGDQRLPVLNLSIQPPPDEIAGVGIKVWQLPGERSSRPAGPLVLQLTYHNQRLLFIPPGKKQWREQLLELGAKLSSDAVWIPALPREGNFWEDRLHLLRPRLVVVTGHGKAVHPGQSEKIANQDWRFTQEGAVTVKATAAGLAVRQF